MVMCLLGNADQYTGLAVGAMLMVLVFAGGHLSGAHYNPVVTVAVWLRGKCSVSDVPIYIFAQLIGAAIAAIVVDSVLLQKLGELNFPKSGLFPTFGSEFLGSFVIVYVLLNVATAKDTAGNSFYGLAVGGCLMGRRCRGCAGCTWRDGRARSGSARSAARRSRIRCWWRGVCC